MELLPCLSWGSGRLCTVLTMLAMASKALPGTSAKERGGQEALDTAA